ncbi:MAG: glucose-6-phosphate dehydrogenase [Anaerolineales bacterium]
MNPPTTIVIFGASGDLTKRKLIPALFSLHSKGRLPAPFHVVGMARSDSDEDGFRKDLLAALETFGGVKIDPAKWDSFAGSLSYVQGDFKEDQAMEELRNRLRSIEAEAGGKGSRLYYLATPPSVYEPALEQLGESGMVATENGWRRVVIEKPFGHDLASAERLNTVAHRVLEEDQIYRIDHYLGKETVQNVLVFRFANSIFEPIWNRNYIDHIQITVAESVDVGHRASFYDSVGVLRDMFQNHLMQLLSLVAMEPPASFEANDIRNERVKVLGSMRPLDRHEVLDGSVLAQYEGYHSEQGVKPKSRTPTYAALRMFIDNWRWKDVPFYLRSGKELTEKTTEIRIQFKSVPHMMFPGTSVQAIRPNALDLCIQPDEGIHLRFEVKIPDEPSRMRSVDMEFHYADAFGPGAIPEAYERLLLDAINGDPSLFTRADTIELSWKWIDSVIEAWEAPDAPELASYRRGSWGPEGADQLLASEGSVWALGCMHEEQSN